MRIWLDTIDIDVVKDAVNTGTIFGITTNPTILSRAKNVSETLRFLLDIQPGPVGVQVTSDTFQDIVDEARRIFDYSSRFIVKIPVNHIGLLAIEKLKKEAIPILGTAVLFPAQALLAGNHNIAYIAPYFSHMANHGDPFQSLKTMIDILQINKSETKILVASLREIKHILLCATLGVDSITIKPDLYRELTSDHPAIESFSQKFSSDWIDMQSNVSIKDLLV